MHGVFVKNIFSNIIILISGLFLAGLFVFIRFVDDEWTNDGYAGIIIGCVFIIISLVSSFHNHKAYIDIDDHSISGHYSWLQKINCRIEDVAYCSAGINTLTILLNTGKRFVIPKVSNSYQLSAYLRERIPFKNSSSKNELTAMLQASVKKRKKDMTIMLFCSIMLFANIFILVGLTGSREMTDFSQIDWIFTAVFGVLESVVLVLAFIYANRAGKTKLSNEYIAYCIRRMTVETQKLPSGNAKNVFTDYDYSIRIITYSIPNRTAIYYVVQLFRNQFQLETTHTSEFFDNEESPDFYINEYTDITADLNFCFKQSRNLSSLT